MSKYDAIVIGGGINGITAACVLSRQRKSVALIEQRGFLGGMATHDRIGPPAAHLLWNVSPTIIRDLGLSTSMSRHLTSIETICLSETDNHVRIKEGSAFYLDGTPADPNGEFKKLTKTLSKYGSLMKKLAEDVPYGVTGERTSFKQIVRLLRFGVSVRSLGKSQMRRFLQDLLMNASDFILDDLAEGPLAGLLAADATRGLFSGPRNPGTVFNLIYRYGHGGKITKPKKGMKNYFEIFEERMNSLNVDIKKNTTTKRILIDNDTVMGVELTNGQTMQSNMVLCSSGLHSLKKLTGVTPFNIEDTRRIRNLRKTGTTAKVNLKLSSLPSFKNVDRPLTDYRFIIAPSVNYVEQAFNPCKYNELSDAPVSESVFIIRSDDVWLSAITQFIPENLKGGWSDSAKDAFVATVIRSLSRFFPEIDTLILQTELITPEDFSKDLGVEGGNWHHCEMSLDQTFNLRPTSSFSAYETGSDGLFLCGASSHPGGDIMGLSGRNAALQALRKIS